MNIWRMQKILSEHQLSKVIHTLFQKFWVEDDWENHGSFQGSFKNSSVVYPWILPFRKSHAWWFSLRLVSACHTPYTELFITNELLKHWTSELSFSLRKCREFFSKWENIINYGKYIKVLSTNLGVNVSESSPLFSHWFRFRKTSLFRKFPE